MATGAISRKGAIKDGNCVGDSTPEARQRQMSVEVNIAETSYLGDSWTFLDCPGSIEFLQDSYNALRIADVAVVVVDPEPARAIMVAPLLQFLHKQDMAHMIFINKVNAADAPLRETLDALQAVSTRPLLLRQLPIKEKDKIAGFIDLISERAFRYRDDGGPADIVKMPKNDLAEEQEARQSMLESLADVNDELMESLLEDVVPPSAELFERFASDVAHGKVVPVLFGSGETDQGIWRLLKSLRHDAPGPDETRRRYGPGDEGPAYARVFKTVHVPHSGKISYARIWRGEFVENGMVNGQRPSAFLAPKAGGGEKIAKAGPGAIVAFGKLEKTKTGDLLGDLKEDMPDWPAPQSPLFPLALEVEKKQDEVKLTAGLAKLIEEDPSLSLDHSAETGEMVLWGQGEIHLLVALEKLKSRFGLAITGRKPQIPYRETIRGSTSVHGRHKRQSGGHGQFGDIHLDIEPLPRGAGIEFVDKIVGGVVPRQYIPAVEEGVRDYTHQGPLGFPVVDIKVTLTNGSYHSVDSSDMAFKTAARIGMSEGMQACDPILLEPILTVTIDVPNEYTSKVQRIISSRRGQILGYEAKKDWRGWDEVAANLPQAEMSDMIIELRSLTMGVGTFLWRYNHLQELTGKPAEKIIEDRKANII